MSECTIVLCSDCKGNKYIMLFPLVFLCEHVYEYETDLVHGTAYRRGIYMYRAVPTQSVNEGEIYCRSRGGPPAPVEQRLRVERERPCDRVQPIQRGRRGNARKSKAMVPGVLMCRACCCFCASSTPYQMVGQGASQRRGKQPPAGLRHPGAKTLGSHTSTQVPRTVHHIKIFPPHRRTPLRSTQTFKCATRCGPACPYA